MSNNSNPGKKKVVPLFIAFAILFIIVFGLGVIIGKGLGGPDAPRMERGYEDKVYSDQEAESDITGEEILDDGSDPANIKSEDLEVDEETVILSDEEEEETQTNNENQQDDTGKVSEEGESAEVEVSPDPKDVGDISDKSPTPAPVTPEPTQAPKVTDSEPKKVEQNKEPPVESLEESSPAAKGAMPKIDPSGKYTVQIGAFQVQNEANKLVSSMKSKGYPAFLQEVKATDGKTWYRVRVGTFTTRSDANTYGNRLKESEPGIKSVFVTVNN